MSWLTTLSQVNSDSANILMADIIGFMDKTSIEATKSPTAYESSFVVSIASILPINAGIFYDFLRNEVILFTEPGSDKVYDLIELG